MNLSNKEKQKVFNNVIDKSSIKLARAIYNTHLQNNENLLINVKVQSIVKLLGFKDNSVSKIIGVLEDINEPLLIQNFECCGKFFQKKFIKFCDYFINDDTIQIKLNREFLHAQENYMIESFLY